MQFSVEPDVFVRFPGMRLAVVVAHDVDNRADPPAVAEAWARAWAAAATAVAPYGNAQCHPRVRAWRERLQATGVSMRQFPTSIEALLRRAMKGGAPFRRSSTSTTACRSATRCPSAASTSTASRVRSPSG
jgi:DNA/RNA-binding domain of Phe-tRNA-synthetase-like protein